MLADIKGPIWIFLEGPKSLSHGSDYGEKYICFREISGSNMGRQTSYLTRAPSKLVTPLTPRSTNKADLGGKKHSWSPGLVRKNAFYCSLKGTFEDLLSCYCCAIKTISRTIC